MKNSQTTKSQITSQAQQDLRSQRTQCEIWTRVMGYHRSVSHFNKGKKVEHYSRTHFNENSSANSLFVQKYTKTA